MTDPAEKSRTGLKNHSGRTLRTDGAATQERILQAAATSFSDQGYRASSLRSIASMARVDLATVKYHFGTKSRLYTEVYTREHRRFRRRIAPLLLGAAEMESADELRLIIDGLAGMILDYLQDHAAFPRMLLYRVLEGTTSPPGDESALQATGIEELASAFTPLANKGLVRHSDRTNMATLLVMGVPMWYLTLQSRGWLRDVDPTVPEGAERCRRFLRELLERYLLFEPALSPELAGTTPAT